MSVGFHANTLTLSLRNLTSASSYLGSRWAMSTKCGRQSTEGYVQGSRLLVNRCARHEPDGNRIQDKSFIQVQAISMT
jgi:transcription initiation factor TFIID subunit TAF12